MAQFSTASGELSVVTANSQILFFSSSFFSSVAKRTTVSLGLYQRQSSSSPVNADSELRPCLPVAAINSVK